MSAGIDKVCEEVDVAGCVCVGGGYKIYELRMEHNCFTSHVTRLQHRITKGGGGLMFISSERKNTYLIPSTDLNRLSFV